MATEVINAVLLFLSLKCMIKYICMVLASRQVHPTGVVYCIPQVDNINQQLSRFYHHYVLHVHELSNTLEHS